MELFLSDDFAVVLGLKKSDYPDRNLPEGKEMERFRKLKLFLIRNGQETEEQKDVIWSRFCAVYLPATVHRLLNLPVPTDARGAHEQEMAQPADFAVYNPWHEMLVQHVPYFDKYLRSTKAIAANSQGLAQVLADRIVAVGGRWDAKMRAAATSKEEQEYYKAAAGSAVQLLSTLCTHYINEKDRSRVVSSETQIQLGKILVVWGKRYEGEFLSDVSLRMLAFMAGPMDKAFNQVRRMYKNWEVCGQGGCQVRRDLKVCARCQTVRYCTPAHQKADWGVHKMYCFSTEY